MTFSQLLVKAHRNEKEESVSQIINKKITMENDSTLEQRVDRLIAKSGQTPPSLAKRDNSRNYGRPPFQTNFKSKSDYRQAPKCPLGDIRPNLRGPEPSAAGPFWEADGSRPIQCFRFQGWGHPKRLCPSRLNYTRGGGNGMGQSLPDHGPDTRKSPFSEPISSTIDMKISQMAEKYHNPDPLLRLIGPANEATIIVEGQEFKALIDSGAQLSTISESLVTALKLPVHKLNTLIEAEVSGGGTVPYIGYVEARLKIPGIKAMNRDS